MHVKDILIQYSVMKAVYIHNILGIKDYITNDDIQDIKSWSERECFEVYNCIRRFHGVKQNRFSCPWCIKWGLTCSDCGYAKRHLKCVYAQSTYNDVVKAIQKKYGPISILNLPGLKKELDKVLNTELDMNYETFCRVNENV